MLSALSIVGCVPEQTPSTTANLELLQERIVFDDPLLLLPGARWEKHESAWRFRNRVSFVCHVRQTPHSGLVVRLIADRPTARHHFQVEWDGEPIGEPEQPGQDGLRIKIPSPGLTPGRHELTLARVYALDEPQHRRQHQNDFQRIRFRYDDRVDTLDIAGLDRSRQIADFLQNGVIGADHKDKLHRGGLLFVGPVRHEVDLPQGTQLRLEARNFSRERVVFRALGEQPVEARVEPGEGGDMRLTVGEEPLALEVEGPDDGLFLWSMPVLEQATSDKLPPVVLVTLDTTRRDALGPYAGNDELTPTLSDFANRATLFENAYSTAPWTLPSHASIFTGLYPSKHGAGVSDVRLAHDAHTLARGLRERGYLTAGFSSGELSSSRFGVAMGFHYFRDPDRFETPGARVAEYVDEFLSAYGERPFFLWINYFDPHALYQAPEEYEERFAVPELRDKVRDLPVWSDLIGGKMSGWRGLVEGDGEAVPEAVEFLEAAYRAEIAYTDHLLDRLFTGLRQRGIFERALVVITADHGELLGEGGYFGHGARLDPELVEIPLLVKWPGQREPQRDARLVSLVDLYPTVLRAAGVEPPQSDGRDLDPASRRDAATHPFVVFEEHAALVHPLPEFMKISPHLYGVQRPDFRQLVWDGGQECARIDHTRAWSTVDCSGKAVNVLEAILAELGLDPAADTGEQEVPDHLRESLEALGYM